MRHTSKVSNFSTLLASAGLAATLLAAACGDGATEPEPPPEPPRATTVAVTPPTAELTALGATVQLSAQVLDQNGQAMAGAAVTWSSGSATIATVSATGLVTAVQNGSVTITATSGSASGNAAVTVAQMAGAVEVTPPVDTLAPGDTLRLSAEATDANGNAVTGIEFSWTSSAAAVARVDNSGLVTAVAAGSATITAATGDASGTSEITVVNPDRVALVALYEATDGPNWGNSENWLTDKPLDDWYGVGTDASGRVVSLDLGGRWDNTGGWIRQGLSGAIPPELGGLANLSDLHLDRNELTGAIPAELGGLVNLRVLNLGGGALARDRNELTGAIPAELGGLANLTVLDLSFNELTGAIPAELGGLANLTELDLWNNRLTSAIPAELGSLANLTELDLGRNALTGTIPAELGGLANLTRLTLSDNELAGTIPTELGSLANLSDLDLDRNELTGAIPAELGGLANLTDLSLFSNELTGAIPAELGGLANLTALYLSSNELTGAIPAELGGLASLRALWLADNELTGRLPDSFLNLSLWVFTWNENAALCAPNTTAFRAWLAGIDSHRPGPFCSAAGAGAAIPVIFRPRG